MPDVPENGSLRVTVKLSKAQVRAGYFCPVEMDVVNISNRPQSFRTFGCSWEEQRAVSDKRLSFPMRPCYWNPLRIILKPGMVHFGVVFQPAENRSFESDAAALKVVS